MLRGKEELISATSGHRPDLGVARILPTLVLVQILNCWRCVITLGTFGEESTYGQWTGNIRTHLGALGVARIPNDVYLELFVYRIL